MLAIWFAKKGGSMKKSFIAKAAITAIFLVMLCNTIFAGTDIVDSMDFTGEGIELTLENAIDVAISQNANPAVEASLLNMEQAKASYQKSKSALKKIKKIYNDEKSLEYLQHIRIPELSNEFSMADAQRSHEATLEGQKAEIEAAYYGLLQAQQVEKINYENMNVSRELYERSNKKYELGLISRQEVLNSELAYINTVNEYYRSQNNLKASKMRLNILLGYDVMNELILKDELEQREYVLPGIANAVESALSKRREVKSAEYMYELESINMEYIRKQYTPNTYAYKEQKAKLDRAERDLENIKKSIEMEVRICYMDVIQKQREIESGKKSIALAEENLKISQVSYEAGIGLATNVQAAQVALQQAKLALSQAILDYNLAVLKFEDSIGVGRK